MADVEYFVIYRVYRPDETKHYDGLPHRYGWTYNKNVLNAFLQQRNSDKYLVDRICVDEYISRHGDTPDRLDMVDMIELMSASTGDNTTLFMTQNELVECELKIFKMFRELSMISNISFSNNTYKQIEYFVFIFNSLRDKYTDALEYIGYRPQEVRFMFDSVEDEFERGYTANDPCDKVVFSLESFIKVLIDDM